MANFKRTIDTGKRPFWKIGEPWVWATGGALSIILLIAVALVVVVIINGMGVFWPSNLAQLTMKDGSKIMGQILQRQEIPNTEKFRIQLKIGNRDLYSLDFKWVDIGDIDSIAYPESAVTLERVEYGHFYGFLQKVSSPAGDFTDNLLKSYHDVTEIVHSKKENFEELDSEIEELAYVAERVRLKQLKLKYDEIPKSDSDWAELNRKEADLKSQFAQLATRQAEMTSDIKKYTATFTDANGRTKTIVLADILDFYQPNQMSVFSKVMVYIEKVVELIVDEPREANTEGGLFPAIFGTVMMVFIMSIFSFPLGVVAAVYLNEYAKEGIVVRLVRIAVNNLAGIPSIVYGVFGLGFFVYGIGHSIDQLFFPERLPTPTFGTGGILWASMTLAILTVPVVIVATEEALSAVPREMKEGSLALGATKLQTLIRITLPMASPGIMTGFILAMARAAGEVAPLMITGVVKLAPSLPMDTSFPYLHLERKFMHLGFHIYDVGFQSPNVEAAKPMVFVTTLLLVLIVLSMTSAAIYLRNKMRKRYTLKAF